VETQTENSMNHAHGHMHLEPVQVYPMNVGQRMQGLKNEHGHYHLAMATMKQAHEQYHLETHMYQPRIWDMTPKTKADPHIDLETVAVETTILVWPTQALAWWPMAHDHTLCSRDLPKDHTLCSRALAWWPKALLAETTILVWPTQALAWWPMAHDHTLCSRALPMDHTLCSRALAWWPKTLLAQRLLLDA
jgi:predicted nucleic acid-binding Zn ribbon protein